MVNKSVFLISFQLLSAALHTMADNDTNQSTHWSDICDQIKDGNYKTVRLPDSRIQLFCGQKSYTFKVGDIRAAQMNAISNLYPFTSTPITQCFQYNERVYYIRDNQLIQYNGLTVSSSQWNQNKPSIPCVIIKRSEQTIGFFVTPNSCPYSSAQSMSSTNDIQVMAYGSGSSVSMSGINNNYRLTYNSIHIPIQFNAFIANCDDSYTFFDGNRYCVVTTSDNSYEFNWKDVKTLFGC